MVPHVIGTLSRIRQKPQEADTVSNSVKSILTDIFRTATERRLMTCL